MANFAVEKIQPVDGQCGTCAEAKEFGYSPDGPSGPEDGVHCGSHAQAVMMDDQTHGDAGSVAFFNEYGFLDLWRLEDMAEESYRCPNWKPKG